MNPENLRPIERCVLKMQADGIEIDEIATRIRRSPEFVERMIEWTEIPRTGRTSERDLTPRQSRVLELRASGETHRQIGRRFKRGEAYIRQVEGLAHFKKAQRILSRD